MSEHYSNKQRAFDIVISLICLVFILVIVTGCAQLKLLGDSRNDQPFGEDIWLGVKETQKGIAK